MVQTGHDQDMPPAATPGETSSVPPSPNGGRGTGDLLRSIATDLSMLVSKQIELAKQEFAAMMSARAKAAGVFAAAAVLALFVIGFLGLAGAEALDLVMPRWAAMLLVAAAFLLIAVIAILAARRWLRTSSSKPALTQESLKEDVAWAKQQIRR